MAAANIGGSSNDASGNNTLRMSIIHKLDLCNDRLVELEILAEQRPISHPIHEVLARQTEEIQQLEHQLSLLR